MSYLKFLFSSILLLSVFFCGAQVAPDFGGTILDQRTNRVVEEMELTVEHIETHKKFVTETNEDGKFTLKKLPVGNYQLAVTDKEYVKEPFNFEVTETHKPNLDF